MTQRSRRINHAPLSIERLEGRTMMSVGPATIAGGGANDSVYDPKSHTLHVVYFDTRSHTLKAQSFRDDGTASAVAVVDTTMNAGMQVSLAEDAKGVLHAAYYDASNGDLRYARRTKGGVWSTRTVDSKGMVGQNPSIAIDADGRPAISYYAKTGGNLRLARFTGRTFSVQTIAAADDVGRRSSLALSVNGELAVAFDDATAGQVLYAEEAKDWAVETVDTTPLGDGTVSLSFGTVRPSLSYYNAADGDLMFASRSARGRWFHVTIASAGDVGLVSDLSYTFNTDRPAIVFYDRTADSVGFAYRSNVQVWNLQTLTTGGGAIQSAQDGADDGVHAPELYVVYSDTATGHLNVRTF